MIIKVSTRFRPFSHNPGAASLVPGQEAIRQVFPAYSEVKTFNGELIFKEPGRKTLFQDLEKPFRSERLSFGNHKQQDIDKIRQRKDLTEILPIWAKLATFYPSRGTVKSGSLLYELIHETDRNRLPDLFLKVYLSGFTPFFVPRLIDEDHNGFHLPPLIEDDPLLLITEGAKAIKRMVIEEKEGVIHVLPNLPSLFHCGRWVDIPLSNGMISIEWTKHFLRRVVYTPYNELESEVLFPKEVKQYRVKSFGKSFVFDNFRG